jgi:hypothetical protein
MEYVFLGACGIHKKILMLKTENKQEQAFDLWLNEA